MPVVKPTSIRDVDNPARNPFQAAVEITMPNGTGGENAVVVVPKGKRLVIEYLSGDASLPAGQKCLFSVATFVNGQTTGTWHYLASGPVGKFGPFDCFRTGQVVRLYADPGTQVQLRADRDIPDGKGVARMSLSGYLVSVP